MRSAYRFSETCCCRITTTTDDTAPTREITPPASTTENVPRRLRFRRPPPVPGCDPDDPDAA